MTVDCEIATSGKYVNLEGLKTTSPSYLAVYAVLNTQYLALITSLDIDLVHVTEGA
jgi:hypothetical protein